MAQGDWSVPEVSAESAAAAVARADAESAAARAVAADVPNTFRLVSEACCPVGFTEAIAPRVNLQGEEPLAALASGCSVSRSPAMF